MYCVQNYLGAAHYTSTAIVFSPKKKTRIKYRVVFIRHSYQISKFGVITSNFPLKIPSFKSARRLDQIALVAEHLFLPSKDALQLQVMVEDFYRIFLFSFTVLLLQFFFYGSPSSLVVYPAQIVM